MLDIIDLNISLKAEEGPLPTLGTRDFPSLLKFELSHKAVRMALTLEVNVDEWFLFSVNVLLFIVHVAATVLCSTRGVKFNLCIGLKGIKIFLVSHNAKYPVT